jgi:hypothetical protein
MADPPTSETREQDPSASWQVIAPANAGCDPGGIHRRADVPLRMTIRHRLEVAALSSAAYRNALVTAEESHAHLDALRRLVGLPALTQVWTDQELGARLR